MKCERVNHKGEDFVKLELVEILQKNYPIYIGRMPAKVLLDLYTVEPAKYDQVTESDFAESFESDEELFEFRKNNRQEVIETSPFQRKESKSRIREISNWLDSEEYAFFPNTIIATCDLISDYITMPSPISFIDAINKKIISPKNMRRSYFDNSEEKPVIYIPYHQGAVLVIDGQHRLKGLESASSTVLEQYDLIIAFIIGYNRAVIAKQFYTVNYTQKSVNKSLLYQLTGEFSYELDEITFLHEIVCLLNELKNSPFYDRVKMLGTIPSGADRVSTTLMTVSQAFLIDYMLPFIVKRRMRQNSQLPIFLYSYQNEYEQIEIPRFLIRYFSAIRELVGEQWNQPEGYMVSKTVAVGALIRIMQHVFMYANYKMLESDPLRLEAISKEMMIEILDGIQNVDTSTEGQFGRTSSEGTVKKLILAFTNASGLLSNYARTSEEYQTNRTQYLDWLKK